MQFLAHARPHARFLLPRGLGQRKPWRPGAAGLLGWVGLSTVCLALVGCGGSGAGPTGGTGGTGAPAELTYSATTFEVRTDGTVQNAPTWKGGTPTAWSIQPPLPPGLALNANTGAIEGIPTAAYGPAAHVIQATNEGGMAETTVTIQVLWSEPKSLLPKASFSDDDIRHFLDRTHFGFSQAHYDLILANGLPAYVPAMTAMPAQTAMEQDAFTTYLTDGNDPGGDFPSQTDMARWWIHMMQANANPFQEVLAFHWHDHFATSSDVLDQSRRHWMVNHVNLLRGQAAGNLRTLLLALARDWAMLQWLDGVLNNGAPGQQPNENFGREWFELFCLGVDNGYTEADIVEAARAFTGYRSRYNANTQKRYIEFDPNRHDAGDKTVLGQTIVGQNATDDYAAMTDITLGFRDPASGVSRCGQWIMRALLRRFVYEDPEPALINQLAELLEASNWELKPVLDTLLLSEAFYCARAKEGFVKAPVEHVIGFARTTGCVGFPAQIESRTRILGNIPTRPPVVDGWPEGASWLSAQTMIDRSNVIEYLIRDAKPLQDSLNVDLADLLPPGTPTPQEVVAALALRLRLELSAGDTTKFVTYLDTNRDGSGNVFPDPFDPTDPNDINEKVRGLLYMMALHPSYLTR